MLKKIALSALIAILALTPVIYARQGNSSLNIMVLSGTTGLSLVKTLDENPPFGHLSANYSVLKDPQQMAAKIISGEADIAALPTNLAATLYNRGIDIKLAAITNWGVMYAIGKDSSLSSWDRLQGKEISLTGKGATPDILFNYLVRKNGLDPEKDLKTKYYAAPVELAQLAIADKVEVAVLPEPWVTEVITKNPAYRILWDFQEEWKKTEGTRESYPMSCLVVKSSLAKDRPDVVEAFLKQAAYSSQWINDYPQLAGELAEKHILISKQAASSAIPRCNLRFAPAYEVQTEVDYFLHKLHSINPQSIGGKIPDEGFYLQKSH